MMLTGVMSKHDVTVIGLGPMGRAMASALLGKGYRVTVWNRTVGNADELVGAGAHRAATVHDALTGSELVILSLTTTRRCMPSLSRPPRCCPAGSSSTSARTHPRVPAALRGGCQDTVPRTSPEVCRLHPPGIGQPGFSTFYSGPKEVGEDPGLAALYYQVGMDLFWTTVLGWLHALPLADAHGVPAEEILPSASSVLAGMTDFLASYTQRIDAGEYQGDIERLAMGVASVDHGLQTARDAGVDTSLPTAVLEIFRRGTMAGHADDSATSLIEVLKKPAA
ncbi:NAD(P)-binding domain-containing protein [Streptomyces thinghirensis]|uniref:NAD(P)-binding domain-containing protein n=2 Tax=Streptomyces thinghirensis TaxID=551547 RepID=A0ABP9T2S2_9ACTN